MSKILILSLMILSMTACTTDIVPSPTSTPVATLTRPTATLTPTPTLAPTPTPTATPTPSWHLTIHWPESDPVVLPPAPVEVELRPSQPGVEDTVNMLASVLDPDGVRHGVFVLKPYSGYRYRATTPLALPLLPKTGEWQFAVAVQSRWPVTGARTLLFHPQPPAFRVLTETLPAGVNINVPENFSAVLAQGDPRAGALTWQYADGEVGLWWAPGPAEPLLLNNALVMLETTHPADWPPEVTDAQETTWENSDEPLIAFRFYETWPAPEEGPAEAWVIQAPNHWLYVLRARGLGRNTVPPLSLQVLETFAIYAQ